MISKNCTVCGEAFVARGRSLTCSKDCSRELERLTVARRVTEVTRVAARLRAVRWRAANRDRHREYARRYNQEHPDVQRASVAVARYVRESPLGLAGVDDRFDPHEIHDRDEWTCWICRRQLDRSALKGSRDAATIDHVVAVTDGGRHSRSNVRSAHSGCNARRHNLGRKRRRRR